jgi:hypothetical protein
MARIKLEAFKRCSLKKMKLWVILRAITSHLIAAQASRVRDRDVARV